MKPAHHQLTMPQKAGFTLGDYASNLYWNSVAIFLLFFYTDAVGLPAATAGLIYMIASIVDAVADPVMGSIADRTRTRHGRYRPYILFGCVPLGLAFVLLYYKPPLIGLWLTLWMLVSHIIFRFAYTVVTIPYTSLNARLTDNSDERSTIAGLRMTFGVLAALTITFFTYPMITSFGRGNAAMGWTWAAVVFAIIATALYPLVYYITREPAEIAKAEERLNLAGHWRAIAGNRAFWVLIIAACAFFTSSVAMGKSVLYYYKYYLQDEAASRYALSIMAVVGLVAIPFWVWLTKLIGKRNVWFVAVVWGLAQLAFFVVFDLRTAVGATIWFSFGNFSGIGLAFTFWSMIPDTVEYGEWATGARTESFIFGLGQFFLKVALGLGAGLFGWLLGQVGYVANVQQTPATLAGLKMIMIGLTGAGLIVSGLVMLFYPLRKGVHESIVDQLAARRYAPTEAMQAELTL